MPATQSYTLDDGSTLLTGVPQRVDANTAAILAGSWLAPHFMVLGDRCGPAEAQHQQPRKAWDGGQVAG
eukprot:364368-Chlamydomonas_euryale.AAC.8